MEHQAPPQAEIFHIIGGYWLSRAVYLAARLKLADAVGDRPTSLSVIARATRTRPETLRRLMRALAAHGFFQDAGNEKFGQTPVVGDAALGSTGQHASIRRGRTRARPLRFLAQRRKLLALGRHRVRAPLWYANLALLRRASRDQRAVRRGMTNLTAIANAGVLSDYQFAPFHRAVDVGGGHGSFVCAILDHHPDASAVLFDLPSVLADAPRAGFVTCHQARLELAGGDFFKAVPSGGDLYLLKFVLHDWDDERSGEILNNIRRVIDPSGRLVVVEIVLPPMNVPHIGPLIDLNMMVMTGGTERTEVEYRDLLAKSGFRMERVPGTRSPFSVIEATPA